MSSQGAEAATATPASSDGDTPGGYTEKEKAAGRCRHNGLHAKSKTYLLNELRTLRKLRTVIGYAVKQSRLPQSRTRSKQYDSFADVIITICNGDHTEAKGFCDFVQGFIDDKHRQSVAMELCEGSFTVTGPQRRRSHTLCSCCWRMIPRTE